MKKVILSTNGPLHLIKSAEYLTRWVDIVVIQGWIPNRFNRFLLRYISKVVGRDLTKSLKKRTPKILDGRNHSVALPEFYFWFGRYFLHKNFNIQTAKLYGYLSKRFITNADIFHVRSGSGLGGAIEKARRKGMKVIVDHSIAHPTFMKRHLQSEFEKNGIRFTMGDDSPFWRGVLDDCEKADCLLVNSHFVRDTFVSQGYDEERIRVVYLGVREDFFNLKKSYTKNQTIKILFTGSFGFRKGGEYLLKALKELDKIDFPYEMTVVGSFNEANILIEKFRPKHIHFTGHIFQDELKKFLADSDIYLFPSLSEGCASSGMEAMAAGLPIICTQESGLPITTEKNGIVVPSKNSEAIVSAIMRLNEDGDLRKELGQNAANMVATQFTWEKYAQSVDEMYSSLLMK